MDNNIIFKKDTKRTDYFAIFMCVFTVLLFIFQVMADRHISKASRDFIEGAKAKRIANIEKARKALREKELEAERTLKQQEEDAYLANIETQFKGLKGQDVKKEKATMDYRQKLEIYRQAQAGTTQRK